MNAPSIFLGQRLNDRDLIESVLNGFFIVDYGFIQKVNSDRTVNVVHAKKLKTMQGVSMPETITKNVEVLTLAGSSFSLDVDVQPGDKVLLLGLKNYIENTGSVTEATETEIYMHYSRSTMKALPLCVFDADAKVTVKIKDGVLTAACSSFKVTDKNGNAVFEVTT